MDQNGIRFYESSLSGWNGIVAESDRIRFFLAPEIGGRLLSILYGGIELLFIQEEHAGETFDFSKETDLRSAKKGLGFRLWGGDKSYIAPQSGWWEGIPPIELDAGRFSHSIEGGTVHMRGGPCHETGLTLRRSFAFDGDTIFLDQEITNVSDSRIERGIWDVTQFLRPVTVFIKAGKSHFVAYPEEGDSVGVIDIIEESEGWSSIPCAESLHFKFGIAAGHFVPTLFSVHYAEGRTIIHRRDFEVLPDRRYAHRGCVEIYNSPSHDYMELEVHGPLEALNPGESSRHAQRWRFSILDGRPGRAELVEYFEGELRRP